jgi:hypothetical protein
MTPAFLFLLLGAVTPPAEYAGHWTGQTRIIVTFVENKTLALDLAIAPDGTVTGQVGDARVRRGLFREHTLLEKAFGNRGYVLWVELDGDLVAAERLHRDGAWVIVRTEGGRLVGGLNSFGDKGLPGQHEYNRRHMMVSCRDLILTRVP